MARNASGVWSNPISTFVQFTVIESAKMNTLIADLGSEITASLPRAGTAAMTGDLPFGSNRATGLAAATAGTDAPQVKQIQNGTLTAAADSGAADAYVVTLAPAVTAYATFMDVWFTTTNTNATTTPTINVNGLGVKNIKADSATAVAVGDISTTRPNHVKYDGTQFILISGNAGSTSLCTNDQGTESNPAIGLDCDGAGSGVGFFGDNSGTNANTFLAITVDGDEMARFEWAIGSLQFNTSSSVHGITGDGSAQVQISGGTNFGSGGNVAFYPGGSIEFYEDNTIVLDWDSANNHWDTKGFPVVDSPTTAKSWTFVTVTAGTPAVTASYPSGTTITDNGAGDFTLNFPAGTHNDANYGITSSVESGVSSPESIGYKTGGTKTAIALQVQNKAGGSAIDPASFTIATWGN